MSDRESSDDGGEESPFEVDGGSFVPEAPPERVDETVEVPEAPTPEPPQPVSVPEPEQHRIFAGTGISWAFVFGVILTVAIIILAVQNTDPVPVTLYFWETEAPLIIVMLVTALVAILIDEMIGLVIRRRKRRIMAEREELRRLRAKADTDDSSVE